MNCEDTITNGVTAPLRSKRMARGSVLARIIVWNGLWVERRKLRGLDDAALRDIGISRAEAEAEAARPMWNPPGHWRL